MTMFKDNKALAVLLAILPVVVVASLVLAMTARSGGSVSMPQIMEAEEQALQLEKLQAAAKANVAATQQLASKVAKMRQGAEVASLNPFYCPPPAPVSVPEVKAPPTPVNRPVPVFRSAWPKLTLDGIMRSGQTVLALINGRLYKVNTKVGDLTLVDIGQNQVVLEDIDGTRRILSCAKDSRSAGWGQD